MATFNYTVDTNPMAQEISTVSNHIKGTTTAVVAMQTAVVLAEAKAADHVCNNVNKGFYTLIRSQISQKIAKLQSEVDSHLMQLNAQRKQLLGIKNRMERDYNMISSRYLKLFNGLNQNLKQRVFELDKPTIDFAVREVEKVSNRTKYLTATVPVSQLESLAASQKIIENKDNGQPKTEIESALLVLDRLAKKLRDKRFRHGAINFDRVEVKFDIDENGKPLRVYFKEAKDSNKLVEEFMLLANKTVAEVIGKTPKGKKAKTFVYRVHDVPNPEKMANFVQFVRRFGYKLKDKGSTNEISKSINDLLDKVQGKKEQNLIEIVAIRAMAKATYTTQNIGHYGLAFPYYTHFTSPIRRYPDMMVHRLLERYLSGGRSVSEDKLEDDCKHCSNMENLAAQAERSSVKYKQVEFMSDKIGKVFAGVISGVTEWGLYVEINENHCEGMVPMRDLTDDYYTFDEKMYCLIGQCNKHRYSLGDQVRIKVVRANLEKKQLDFILE
ncbi:hypothetical protein FACS189463_1690 [Bacteroidia bacterium]|nr:hypothetical protein FACS189463_1690 [Bacteroidia bacterium]